MKFKLLLLVAVVLGSTLWSRNFYSIKESGELRVGIRVRTGVLGTDKASGFHYDLIKAFAHLHNLNVKLLVQNAIGDYLEGGIFDKVDVIVDNLTITEERKNRIQFIYFLPVRMVIVSQPGTEVTRRLKNQTLVVAEDSSYHAWAKNEEVNQALGNDFKFFLSKSTENQYQDMVDGKGTITLLDSNLAVLYIKYPNQISKTMITEIQTIGWGVEPKNDSLGNRLDHFLWEVKYNGYFQELWDRYMKKINYDNYIKLIRAEDHHLKTIPLQKEIIRLIDETKSPTD